MRLAHSRACLARLSFPTFPDPSVCIDEFEASDRSLRNGCRRWTKGEATRSGFDPGMRINQLNRWQNLTNTTCKFLHGALFTADLGLQCCPTQVNVSAESG